MMIVNLLHLTGDMSADLNRVYEQAQVVKEETASHGPVKVLE